MNILGFLLIIFAINLIIFIHEIGHFLFAKLFKVKIEKFSIGFGKELCGFTKNDVRYSLSLVPFGGFVKMKGESIFENDEAMDNYGSFAALSSLKKIVIISSGSFMNIVFAFFILLTVTIFNGINYVDMENMIIGEVLHESPSYFAGLKVNDKITKINDELVSNWNDYNIKFDAILNQEAKNLDKNLNKISLTVERFDPESQNVEHKIVDIIPEYNEKFGRKMIGISPFVKNKKVNIFENLKITSLNLLKISKEFYKLFDFTKFFKAKNEQKLNVVGPVGIIMIMQESLKHNFVAFFSLIAIISLNLGLINLLPLPILDGGYNLIFFIELIIKRKINRKFLYVIFNAMILFLIFFMIFVTFKDFLRI